MLLSSQAECSFFGFDKKRLYSTRHTQGQIVKDLPQVTTSKMYKYRTLGHRSFLSLEIEERVKCALVYFVSEQGRLVHA